MVAHFLYHSLCLGAHLVGFLSWRWLHVTLCYKVCPVLLGEVCSLCPCKIKSTIDWRGCSTERDSVRFLFFYGGSLLTFLIKFVDNLNHCDNFFLFHIWLVFRDHFRRVNCDEFCRTALCFIANAAFFVESLACSLAFARCWHSLSHVVCLNDDFLTSFNARKMWWCRAVGFFDIQYYLFVLMLVTFALKKLVFRVWRVLIDFIKLRLLPIWRTQYYKWIKLVMICVTTDWYIDSILFNWGMRQCLLIKSLPLCRVLFVFGNSALFASQFSHFFTWVGILAYRKVRRRERLAFNDVKFVRARYKHIVP